MILGTANFGMEYNGVHVKKKDVFKILEKFELLGGEIVDTSPNYGNAHELLKEYIKKNKSKLLVQSKAWDLDDVTKIIDDFGDNLYSILNRDVKNSTLQDYLYYNDNFIGGSSIYWPSELVQKSSITMIPCNQLFSPYLTILNLYSNIQVRSVYNLWFKQLDLDTSVKESFITKLNSIDFEYVIGVDNVEQLEFNMDMGL